MVEGFEWVTMDLEDDKEVLWFSLTKDLLDVIELIITK